MTPRTNVRSAAAALVRGNNNHLMALRGRAVVISGGTSGIGLATAVLLAAHGARVLVFGRRRNQLRQALKQITHAGEGYGLVADQAVQRDVKKIFAEADRRLGGLDILINNAAIDAGSLLKGQWDDWEYAVRANLLGCLACCRYAIDRMRKRGGGHIVNVGSMSADLREEGNDIYVATKAAIQAFSQSLRKQVNRDQIRLTLIEPGAVATPIQKMPKRAMHHLRQKLQMLPPGDIAETICWCLTRPARANIAELQIRPLMQLI